MTSLVDKVRDLQEAYLFVYNTLDTFEQITYIKVTLAQSTDKEFPLHICLLFIDSKEMGQFDYTPEFLDGFLKFIPNAKLFWDLKENFTSKLLFNSLEKHLALLRNINVSVLKSYAYQ